MNEKALQKAREFERKYQPHAMKHQPKFHVTGGVGWNNDPNGFAPYKGEYHLFFQYYPYDTKWGPMHWGHVKTRDFIRWDRLPCALAPDRDYDKFGCFSGSAIELEDGRHLLLYTGARTERRRDGKVVFFQTQCAAIGNGVDYEKVECNPLIGPEDLPEGGSIQDFRDPKIWREDGRYYLVVGNRSSDTSGQVLMYESNDGLNWQFLSVLASCHNQYGKMWECPDFFPLDGRHVLLVSPQEMGAIGLEFHPGNANVCLIGSYDREKHHLNRENVQAVDYGLDFYAPQTLETADGRRVMIAWMQNWETSGCKAPDLSFFGQMTVPRELGIRNKRLVQNPVRELESFRKEKIAYSSVMIAGETTLAGISGRCMDMTVTVRPMNAAAGYKRFVMNVARDGEHFTSIRFRPDMNTIRVDRTRSGFPHDIVNVREFPVQPKDQEIKLRVIMDLYSLELFVNDGEQAASFIIYTSQEAKAVSFASEGATLIDVEKYTLEIE